MDDTTRCGIYPCCERSDGASDDDEPLTDLWLNGLSGRGFNHKGCAIEIGPLEFEPWAFEAGGPVTLHPDTPRVPRILSTRGCVRRLAAALGITLHGEQPREGGEG